MKRQAEEEDSSLAVDDNFGSNKKKKLNSPPIVVFSKDLCFNICEYLDSEFVLTVARLISVDWWKASELLDYSLKFENVYDSEFLEFLFENQVLVQRLKRFKFSSCNLEDGISVFKELKESQASDDKVLFPNLISLNLRFNNLTDEHLELFCSLIDEKFMCNLTKLNLGFNTSIETLNFIPDNAILRRNIKTLKLISLSNLRDFSSALSRMESLTHLDLQHCHIEEGELEKLLHNESMKNLSKLYVSDVNEFSIDEELVKCQHISEITVLSVNSCSMDMVGNHFKHPKFLNLRILELTDTVNANLDQLCHLKKLELLQINSKDLTDRDIQMLCKEKSDTMKKLDLSYCRHITDSSIDLITTTFPKLSTLMLYGLDITIESTKLITSRLDRLTALELSGSDQSLSYQYLDCPNMKNLKTLKLFSHKIGDGGLGALIKSPYLSKLENLWLRNCNISNESAILFASKECQMRRLQYLDLTENEALQINNELGKEWIENEEEEEEEDMTVQYVIRRNIPSLQRIMY